jgi:hypothetical protein
MAPKQSSATKVAARMLTLARAAACVLPMLEEMCIDAANDDNVTVEKHKGMAKALACVQDLADLELGLVAMSTSKTMKHLEYNVYVRIEIPN